MAGEFPFPILGHGVVPREELQVWIVFRDPGPHEPLVATLPAPFARDEDGSHERILAIGSDEFPHKGKKAAYARLDDWLVAIHARQPIRFVVFSDGDDEPAADPWNEWSQARVKKVLLPWFVEHWPAMQSAPAVAVLVALLARCAKTRRADVIALAARAADAALGHDKYLDGPLAANVATLLARLPDDAARAQELAQHSAALRLAVWTADSALAPPRDALIEAIRGLDRDKPFGVAVSELADLRELPELHELALEFADAPLRSLLEAIDTLRGDALIRVLDAPRFAELSDDDLMTLLHRALEKELDPLIERCVAQAANRDVPGIVANVLYATSNAGKPYETVRLGREFVARYREDHPGPLLATLYTNILLAYGATATCDDTCRMLTEEIERLLVEDPAYFGPSGNAHRDILASAYGSAACGRCVMGDGERSARWLEKAREHEWDGLALCANLICFQHMTADPHLKPVITAISQAEVARLEKSLVGKKAKDPGALFTLALTLHNAGHLDAAERYYTKVLELRPKHADSHNNLGNIHGTRGAIDLAIASYDRAIAIVSEQPVFHACKAWALARGKRYRESVVAGDLAVKLAPNQASGYFSRGAGHLGCGDRDKARADFRRGAALNPGWRGSEKDDPWFPDMVSLIEG